MTREERIEYSKAMNVIEYKIIGRRDAHMPTDEQMNAIMLSVGSMQRRMEEKGLPLRKHIAVLQYHINEPRATIFKDRNTLDALSHGILAMKWMVGTDNYDINGVQI